MTLTVSCPDCDKTLKVKDDAAGKKIRCPACSTVFPVPARSDDEDDFLSDLNKVVGSRRKRVELDEDDVDDDSDDADLPPKKSRASKPVKNKKRAKGKRAGGSKVVAGVVIALVGAGVLIFGGVVIATVAQIQKVAQNRGANWTTFRHPSGIVQIDMPGTPTFNAQQSVNGSQTYSLGQRNYSMSLTSISVPVDISNPATADLIFNEIVNKAPQQTPGAQLLSSRRITTATYPGMEMRLRHQGKHNLMRFYIVQRSLVGAEFITNNESDSPEVRDRFFQSLRGPDGNVIDGPLQAPVGTVSGQPAASSPPTVPPTTGGLVPGIGSLSDARRVLATKLVRREQSHHPLPTPPPSMAKVVSYDGPGGKLAAYVTTIPQDGQRHPAIVWISGGDCNSIDDGFFKTSPRNNDQTAAAFRESGIVTMYPSLRGGNENPGYKESFLGEVDDVIAAADYLSKLDGIDPDRIYLGGHSTGGTLALLVAESTGRFRAVFSFGPVEDIRGYGDEFIPFDSGNPLELDVRTPGKWLGSIKSRTFVLEGARAPGNASSLTALSRVNQNSQVTFLEAAQANHFNILAPVTKLIAGKILKDTGATTNITINQGELNLKYAP